MSLREGEEGMSPDGEEDMSPEGEEGMSPVGTHQERDSLSAEEVVGKELQHMHDDNVLQGQGVPLSLRLCPKSSELCPYQMQT